MLDDPRVKALSFPVDRLAELVEAAVADADPAGHDTAQARHGQAALPALDLDVAERRDDRIDEHRFRYAFRIGITQAVLHAENYYAKRYADLRRGQTRAVQSLHRIAHID